MMMPRERAIELHQLHLLAIQLADDNVVEGVEE